MWRREKKREKKVGVLLTASWKGRSYLCSWAWLDPGAGFSLLLAPKLAHGSACRRPAGWVINPALSGGHKRQVGEDAIR